jgi:hypothetical protein
MRKDQDAVDRGTVVEWAPWRLAPGVSESAVLDGSDALQRDFLSRQPGFVGRELLRGPDGQWVDLLYWEDQASADAAMRAASASPVCSLYFRLMADGGEAGAGVLHLQRVKRY